MTNNLNLISNPTESEINSHKDLSDIINSFKKSKSRYKTKIDLDKAVISLEFNAQSVPKDIADDFLPGKKYSKYVSDYNTKNKHVTCLFKNIVTESVNGRGKMIVNRDKSSFKSSHICSGCGKTLDQCTCEVEDEDKVNEVLNVDESLKESTQLKFDNYMIDDIEVLHRWRPEEVERILIKHGSDKNNDNWIDGLDVPAAYDELMTTFRDKYSDYDEIDYGVAKVLGLVEEESLNEGLSPKEGDRVRMDHYSKVNNGQEGTVTGRLGEICWVTWDDGTKSKEIKGYLTVIERDGKPVNESATQSSSIGQHKVDSIDLLEPKESLNLDSDGKRLKKLISQLVLDSDEELRDYVNKIIDEVIEERSGSSTTQTSSIGQHKVDSIDLLDINYEE